MCTGVNVLFNGLDKGSNWLCPFTLFQITDHEFELVVHIQSFEALGKQGNSAICLLMKFVIRRVVK